MCGFLSKGKIKLSGSLWVLTRWHKAEASCLLGLFILLLVHQEGVLPCPTVLAHQGTALMLVGGPSLYLQGSQTSLKDSRTLELCQE